MSTIAGARPTDKSGSATLRTRVAGRLALMRRLPQWAKVALCGYAIIVVFAVAYLLVGLLTDAAAATQAVAAVLVAAPLALGLLWPRLAGFKAFGFEVALTQSTVAVDVQVAAAIAQPDAGSRNVELVRQIATLAERRSEAAEVNLGDGSSWWTTRLFLFAALAQEFSVVQLFVFVAGDERRFVGMAVPGEVRRAFAT